MSRPLSMTPRAIKAREAIARERLASRCLDCQTETTFTPRGKNDEYYMIHNDLWLKANPAGAGKLCIGCLEKRIRLTPEDFHGLFVKQFPARIGASYL
jgi:hypothetical protein